MGAYWSTMAELCRSRAECYGWAWSHSLYRFVQAGNTTAGAAHLFNETFWTDKSRAAHGSIFIDLLDFPKLARSNVGGIIGFCDDSLKQLRLEWPKNISRETTPVD